MSLKRLIGAGALSLYAGMVGTNSLSSYQEYHDRRNSVFNEFISRHVKMQGDLGISPATENAVQITEDYVPNTSYLLAVNVGFPTSFLAGVGALYLLSGRRKEE